MSKTVKSSFKPFLVNSNFCYTQDECNSPAKFFDSIAGNTGNSYITYAIFKILYGRVVKIPEIKNLWSWNYENEDAVVDQINTQHSHVIFCLQDQIRLTLSYNICPDWKRINQFLKRLKTPFIVFSLGANTFSGEGKEWYKSLSSDFIEFLHILSQHCVSLGVRGESTLQILEKLGIKNANPVGCPTFFETGPDRVVCKKTLSPEDKALGVCSSGWVLQDERHLIEPVYFNVPLSAYANTRRTAQELFGLANGMFPCFVSIDVWKNYVSQYVFSCSSRVHGGILSINAGVPTVITNDDLRANEMCRLFHIPHRPDIDPLKTNWHALYEETDFSELNKYYPLLYKQFRQWLAAQGLNQEVINQLHQWADTQPVWKEPVLERKLSLLTEVDEALCDYQFYIPSSVLVQKLLGKRVLPILRKLKIIP